MVRDAASSKPCGPQLLARAGAHTGVRAPPRTQRNPAILLQCLKELSQKMLSNALVKSIFRCKFIEKRAKNMLPKVRVAANSKLCCPLASCRPRRIPNLASLIVVPSDANLTALAHALGQLQLERFDQGQVIDITSCRWEGIS